MVITLIGYRGTGKSTVGRLLAIRLGLEFADTDALLEQRAGKAIARVFAEDGEPEFRRLESAILAEQIALGNRIISSGGGAILSEDNRRRMQSAGPVVWLQASVPAIIARLRQDPSTLDRRPSLTGTDVTSEISTVLAQRIPLYQRTATLACSTEDRSPQEIVDDILAGLHLGERSGT